MRSTAAFFLWGLLATALIPVRVAAHDIPNARVDRSTQVTLRPGKLAIDYEVSLSELTLTQDLRGLIGALPEGDRPAWFSRYGAEVGPLNAKGFVIAINGEPIDLVYRSFDLVVDDHPKFTFRVEAEIPREGRLKIFDTNYAASEGTCRLALRGEGGVSTEGDSLPTEVKDIPLKPVWQLSAAEEKRSKSIDLTFRSSETPVATDVAASHKNTPTQAPTSGLTGLLDTLPGRTWPFACVLAFILGAGHSLQPGHGKTLVAAGAIGHRGSRWRGAALGVAAATGHMASVSVLAGVLWLTRDTHYERWNDVILHATGFWIAATGLWRIGYHIGDSGQQAKSPISAQNHSHISLLGLGFVSGLVPCWDAVALLLIATAVGRLGLGLILLFCFSLGMAFVLVGVGLLATQLRMQARTNWLWERRLGIGSGCLLALLGALFLIR